MKHNLHNPFVACAGVRLAILSATFALGICQNATAITWDGGANTNNWSGNGSGGNNNWNPNGAPAPNDDLVFAGTTRLSPNNNTTANTNYNSITFNSGAGAFTLGGNAITLGGNVTNNDADTQTINMNLILSGTRTFNASTGNLAVGGVVSESSSGIGALIKTGGLTLTLTNQNTYTGGTTINAGTLALGHATNTLANTGAVAVDGATAILSIAGNSDTVGAVSLKNGGQITGSGGTLTGSSYAVESGSVSAILGGSGISLTKSTAGTVTLSGANSYSGSTIINGGILALASTGSINNSSGVVLNNGTFSVSAVSGGYAIASLAGNGSVTGDLSVSGTLGIGASPGMITFNDDLTLGGSSISNFEITLGFATYDLATSGLGSQTANFAGTLNLLFDSGFNTAGSVKIFDFDVYGGNFTSVVASGLASGFTATFDETTGIVTVVPEPGAAFLGSLGALALLRRRRVR
jgi:autotransporter-associated beta strand protein